MIMSSYSQFRPAVSSNSQTDNTMFNSVLAGTCQDLVIPSDCTAIQQSFASYNRALNTVVKTVTFNGANLSFGVEAFYGSRSLTSLTLNGAVSAGKAAFKACAGLTSVSGGITSITVGESAFEGCDQLITFPFNKITGLSNSAFKECEALTSVALQDCSVAYKSFYGCTALTTVQAIGGSFIGEYAFYECGSLVSTSFPDIATIWGYCFQDCTSLQTISLPSVAAISGASQFSGCTALTSVSLPLLGTADPIPSNCATGINTKMFENCRNLTTVNAPEATAIGNLSFNGCSSLASLSLPKVTTLTGNYPFYGCTHLTSLTLPELTTLSYNSLVRYSSLQTLELPKLTTTTSNNFYNGTTLTSVTLGSIGNPVTSLYSTTFQNCTQSGLTITLYVTDPTVVTSTTNWGATNATVIYKSSVDGSTFA